MKDLGKMTVDSDKKIDQLEEQISLCKSYSHNLYLKKIIYETAMSWSADGFIVVGRDGLIMEINHSYCDYFGINREDTLGKHIYSVISNSKMIKIMDERLTEIDAMHTFPDGLAATGEKMVAVTRMPVIVKGEVIASVAIVKFSHYTVNIAKTLHKLENELAYYRKKLRKYEINSFDDMPSENANFDEIKRMARRFSRSDLPILLLGETGVGKEVFANSIHQASDRADNPFICVNCASIPEELLESELFGYEEGAFTGGRKTGKKGKFEIANGGTLFLDEIGEMPPQMQSKLLRVLQNQQVEKLGAEKPILVDVRIVAATNQDLSLCVQSKKFRPDLYYRLNVLPITIPPLRERVEDISRLADTLLAELIDTYGRKVSFSKEAKDALLNYSWPGNVRELRNAIGRGFMMTEGEEILPHHLPAGLRSPEEVQDDQSGKAKTIQDIRSQTERQLIIDCLKKHNGNIRDAARELGIHRGTLYSRIHALDIPVAQFRHSV